MTKITVDFEIKIAWWFKYLYMPMMQLFCATFGAEPDMKKVEACLGRALKLKVVK